MGTLEHERDLSGDVSRHDAEIENLGRQLTALDSKVDRGFGEMWNKLNDIGKAVSGIGRTDTKTILSVLGVMFAGSSVTFGALVVIGGLVTRPVIEDIKELSATTQEMRQRSEENRSLIIRAHESLRGAMVEQETQLSVVEDVADMRIEALYLQLNAERAAKGEPPLDKPTLSKKVVNRTPIPGLYEGGK